ncbi:peptide deformylase [Streptomyces fuscichromogenes]|uniref:peptide deformylase n=1 Tax=Streptomyces fuscichromogenes TaxID=1324013 RepID=UPI001E654B75|nr:peptide deformylase [Streptomyces fuscichromogenes]
MDGTTVTTAYERGLARLIAHEIDHLNGLLYRSRMRPGVEPSPSSSTGRPAGAGHTTPDLPPRRRAAQPRTVPAVTGYSLPWYGGRP